jgi:hypothetical protein
MNEHERETELPQALRAAVDRLPRSIEPPQDLWPGIRNRIRGKGAGGRGKRRTWWVPLTLAAVLLVAIALWRSSPRNVDAWEVQRVAGAPRVNDVVMGRVGSLRIGQWLETDDSSRALLAVGDIGEVDVKPGTRLRLVEARSSDHRLALAVGSIYAQVDAPPRLFFVETPAGTAVDLGCAYTLDVDSLGNGVLRVTGGYVEFSWSGRRSIVPLGAQAETRVGRGPGTPYLHDAPDVLRQALRGFDFEDGGDAAARTVLGAARAEDALTLWHLLRRVTPGLRPDVYDRLATLVPPPGGVERDAALRLEAETLERYWERIRRIAWRREILRGVRVIDPGTGLTK